MTSLTELTDKLATAAVTADPTDLAVLADMHGQLKALEAMATDARVKVAAGAAEQLVQQIVFNEVSDAGDALQRVRNGIADIQKLIDGVQGSEQPANDDAGLVLFDAAPAAEPVDSCAADSGGESPEPAPDDHTADVPSAPINPDDLPLVLEFISESNTHIETAEAEVLKLEDDPENNDTLNAIFRSFHTIKGVAGFLNLTHIGRLAHAAENLLDLARQGKLKLAGVALDITLESIDVMKALVGSVDRAVKAHAPPEGHPKLHDLVRRLGLVAEGKLGTRAEDPQPREVVAKAAADEPKAAAGATHGEGTVKVATDRLDALINTVGELVIAQSMVAQDVTSKSAENVRLARNMAHLGKITRELQELSMSMRMVPIGGVFQKMSRLVRDVARKAGKEINLVLTGKETELDRNVVEAISDPLVHMVRNAADHGVEPPDVREQSGKPRNGTIELKACHASGSVVIEIVDDGKGLDAERILKKAVANGIVKESDAPNMSEAEVFKLVFAAGLSTAERITDISGRGVGMDVVKKNVEALRGRIDIQSAKGKGSTFTIRLPLTLAVIDGLVVKVGDQRYILPITSIEQSMRPKREQLSTVQGRGEVCLVRGTCLPVFRLHQLFAVKPRFEDPCDALVVIVQDNDRRCCLLVDELLGQEQVVIKSLGESLGQVPGTSGGAILGDGNVSLILDVPGIMDLASGT
ncbi:MAG TPA: chemotaxis protein CheA [Tepidisphaeraceae bacterium]|nr:chemotaxis protein CheA [Tepidisphaeraceae bacterium]